MNWLEELAEERRKNDANYAAIEAKIAEENGGYEIELMTTSEGCPLGTPILVSAGDANGSYHIA